ncbi:hypothetical protein VNO77_21872 [Canavalia gladiata]|uniref:Uncharacterized protein n=1 Tax=Canavalia gladiata TaxID=3824 RepID=A0AAN9L2F5_CANGL
MQTRKGTRNLSCQELMEQRNNELFFTCKHPYNLTYQCLDKYLRLLIWRGDKSKTESLLAIEGNEKKKGRNALSRVVSTQAVSHLEGNEEMHTPIEKLLAIKKENAIQCVEELDWVLKKH